MDEAGKQIAGDFRDWEADAAARAFFTSKPRFDRDAGVFYDPLVPEEKLVILGAGHVGHALALAAAPLGFQITVVDDRAEFLGRIDFPPEVDRIHGEFAQLIDDLSLDTSTYIVIVTRNHGLDLTCVRAVLPRKSRYVGVMGSARKIADDGQTTASGGVRPGPDRCLVHPHRHEILTPRLRQSWRYRSWQRSSRCGTTPRSWPP